jgi:hypothetical protein
MEIILNAHAPIYLIILIYRFGGKCMLHFITIPEPGNLKSCEVKIYYLDKGKVLSKSFIKDYLMFGLHNKETPPE